MENKQNMPEDLQKIAAYLKNTSLAEISSGKNAPEYSGSVKKRSLGQSAEEKTSKKAAEDGTTFSVTQAFDNAELEIAAVEPCESVKAAKLSKKGTLAYVLAAIAVVFSLYFFWIEGIFAIAFTVFFMLSYNRPKLFFASIISVGLIAALWIIMINGFVFQGLYNFFTGIEYFYGNEGVSSRFYDFLQEYLGFGISYMGYVATVYISLFFEIFAFGVSAIMCFLWVLKNKQLYRKISFIAFIVASTPLLIEYLHDIVYLSFMSLCIPCIVVAIILRFIDEKDERKIEKDVSILATIAPKAITVLCTLGGLKILFQFIRGFIRDIIIYGNGEEISFMDILFVIVMLVGLVCLFISLKKEILYPVSLAISVVYTLISVIVFRMEMFYHGTVLRIASILFILSVVSFAVIYVLLKMKYEGNGILKWAYVGVFGLSGILISYFLSKYYYIFGTNSIIYLFIGLALRLFVAENLEEFDDEAVDDFGEENQLVPDFAGESANNTNKN